MAIAVPDTGRFSPIAFRREVASRGLNMRELARLSGIHEISLYRYAGGHTQPSSRSLTKLAMTLARMPALPVDLIEKKTEAASTSAPVTSAEGSASATPTS